MYIRHLMEVILTALLFLSRVWSRPAKDLCDGGRKEGDKWFDGCSWCICQDSRKVCSSSGCSSLVSQTQPCKNVGSSWQDGCYFCKCHQMGIECTADEKCSTLMRSKQFRSDFLLPATCVQPKDERCVCGIDSIPSCTAEVIDMNAFHAITIELTPTFSNFKNVIFSPDDTRSDRSNTNVKTSNERTIESSDVRFENSENKIETIPNYPSLDESLSYHQQVSSTKLVGSNIHSQGLTSSQTENPLGLVTPYLDLHQTKNDLQERESVKTNKSHIHKELSSVDGYRQPDDRQPGDRQPGDSTKAKSIYEPAATSSPSLLIVSANLCRLGERWYGGSLRCYCGQDNSITCGDPSLVTSRIDRFGLRKVACKQGHTWEDKESCTVCQCQTSGVAWCRRSPSCLLPFHLKQVSEDPTMDFEISGMANHKHGQNTDNKAQRLFGNYQTASNTANKLPLHGTNNGDTRGTDIHISKASHILDVSSDDIDETSSKYITEEGDGSGNIDDKAYFKFNTDGSGDVHSETIAPLAPNNISGYGQNKSTEYLNNHFTKQPNILDFSNKTPNLSVALTTENHTSNLENRTQYPYRQGMQANRTLGDNESSNIKTTPETAVRECKPTSRWIDGCRRCLCDQSGKKHCDDSRCLKTLPTHTEDLPSAADCVDTQNGRPVQCPPANITQTRDYPIDLNNTTNSINLCGRFKPGQVYWVDCNICLCTSLGPKCTAKNCT